MTKQNLKFWISVCSFTFWILNFGFYLYAQDQGSQVKIKRAESLILAAPKDKEAILLLEDLSKLYLSQHNYEQLMDFLKKLEETKVTPCTLPYLYFVALCRYEQLKYLEETQNWQEYFDLGNSYRQELFLATEKLVKQCPLTAFSIRAQLINWSVHKLQNDFQIEDSLLKLIDMVNSYAQLPDLDIGPSKGNLQVTDKPEGFGVDLSVIKEVADALKEESQMPKAKAIYTLYANRLLANDSQGDKLLANAEAALSEGNIELSKMLYERYVEIIVPSYSKDDLAKELIPIAKQFLTSGWAKGKDPVFAEGIFKKLKESCGMSYFSETLQYLRAYNLQRLNDYLRCIEEYKLLTKDFPASIYLDEAEFKLGILYIYILGQEDKGLTYLDKVIERSEKKEYVAESLYHKSLLRQLREDFENANAGYSKILDLVAGDVNFKDLLARIEARQKEIKESKEMEYNLKTFLDSALAKNVPQESTLELQASPFKALKLEKIEFSLAQATGDTGCLSPEFSYLWSGDLGGVDLVPSEANFLSEYKTPGTKVVNLVVLDPSGVFGRTLEMAEIYSQKD